MSIGPILLITNGQESEAAAVKTAFQLAQRGESHLEALFVRPSAQETIPIVGEGMSGSLVGEMMQAAEQDAQARAQIARTLYDKELELTDIPVREAPVENKGASVCFREIVGREDEVVAARGRVFDVTVCAHLPDQASAMMALDAAMLETGRPLLVVPPEFEGRAPDHAVIGWNGSMESARAVASAMPLLELVKKVTIVTVCKTSAYRESAEQLQQTLAWRGIEADLSLSETVGRSVADTLLKHMESCGGDVLVMGAYSHSRMRELILGGVTRGIIEQTNKPVWFCH